VSVDEGGWTVLKPFLAEHPDPLQNRSRRRLHDAQFRSSESSRHLPDR
jgi:hypothetical protein